MSVNVSRRERKKIECRDSIREAALDLFLSKGFVETTIADIMKKADLGVGTFYNHFGSKEEILNLIVSEKLTQVKEEIEAAVAGSNSARDKLMSVMHIIAQVMERDRPLFLLLQQTRHQRKPMRPLTHGRAFGEMISSIIINGQKSGEFTKDIPSSVIQELIHSILQSTVASSNSIGIEKNFHYKLNIIFNGILGSCSQ